MATPLPERSVTRLDNLSQAIRGVQIASLWVGLQDRFAGEAAGLLSGAVCADAIRKHPQPAVPLAVLVAPGLEAAMPILVDQTSLSDVREDAGSDGQISCHVTPNTTP